MEIFECTASHQDAKKVLSVHHLVSRSDTLTEKSLLFLVKSLPEGNRSVDKFGMLPYHHTCLNNIIHLEVLMLITHLYVEAAKYFQPMISFAIC
jgi:hypothetical protein